MLCACNRIILTLNTILNLTSLGRSSGWALTSGRKWWNGTGRMRRAPKNSGAKRQTHKRTIDGVEEGPGGDFLSLFLRTKKPHESEWKKQNVKKSKKHKSQIQSQ